MAAAHDQLARAVVLVEGISDQIAVETLAERRGRNLEAEGISIVPIGGAQAIGNFLDRFGPKGYDLELAGLCDAGEEGASGVVSSEPASASSSLAERWNDSVSMCASQTSRTS